MTYRKAKIKNIPWSYTAKDKTVDWVYVKNMEDFNLNSHADEKET